MRQGQQSRRGRNRGGGGGRKPQNPITRNYESSGPDIKIRGTAMHIAEKYTALARDAMASGDIVMAENYLQHAEHYNRIVTAAQQQSQQAAMQQQPQPQPQPYEGGNGLNGGAQSRGGYPEFLYREVPTSSEDEGDEGDEPAVNGHRAPAYTRNQPVQAPQPYEVPGMGEQPQADAEEQERQPRRRRRRPHPGSSTGLNGREHQPAASQSAQAGSDDDNPSGEATA